MISLYENDAPKLINYYYYHNEGKEKLCIIETFGHYVENLSYKAGECPLAVKNGLDANQNFALCGIKTDASQTDIFANLMMDTMLRPLPETGGFCYCKYFTPCEMMEEVDYILIM